ncbi:TPA: elongation factor P maturation arginine rhamnosyltransferase EarP, partial [Pseudomonas aeruginosa]|nr:elongation factor P maturation arginine rhamnosyltransferase EarP [Pseudomonas aeruginosa]
MASWEIFCSVVDNYGDIGVTWRLARQLAAEHGQAVRLWVDEPQAFARICPRADPAAHVQSLDGVEVRAWGRPWAPVAAADVVIEAFACELPEAHRQAMRERERPSLWLNLEYLSAEEWIGSCHALPSLQACGLSKYFFFPGFREPSGGL